MRIRSNIRRATIKLLRISAAQATGRFVSHCHACSAEVPAGQEGAVLQEELGFIRKYWIAALCPACQTWWIVTFDIPTAEGKKRHLRPCVGVVRRATPVEAAMAHLRLHLPTKPKAKSRRRP